MIHPEVCLLDKNGRSAHGHLDFFSVMIQKAGFLAPALGYLAFGSLQ
jgi:hypothetical protein